MAGVVGLSSSKARIARVMQAANLRVGRGAEIPLVTAEFSVGQRYHFTRSTAHAKRNEGQMLWNSVFVDTIGGFNVVFQRAEK